MIELISFFILFYFLLNLRPRLENMRKGRGVLPRYTSLSFFHQQPSAGSYAAPSSKNASSRRNSTNPDYKGKKKPTRHNRSFASIVASNPKKNRNVFRAPVTQLHRRQKKQGFLQRLAPPPASVVASPTHSINTQHKKNTNSLQICALLAAQPNPPSTTMFAAAT